MTQPKPTSTLVLVALIAVIDMDGIPRVPARS